jgi:pimeloyl-ACP methyl ester carboxylesterase
MNLAFVPTLDPVAGFTRNDITLSSGITLEYVRRGDTSGVPVILLHGVTDSWRSFEWMLPRLPSTINAYAISVRGHGGSDRPAHGYEAEDFARDINGFMERSRSHRRSSPVIRWAAALRCGLRWTIRHARARWC